MTKYEHVFYAGGMYRKSQFGFYNNPDWDSVMRQWRRNRDSGNLDAAINAVMISMEATNDASVNAILDIMTEFIPDTVNASMEMLENLANYIADNIVINVYLEDLDDEIMKTILDGGQWY